MGSFGYWVDMQGVQLSSKDGKNLSWIQCMPNGSWEHPFYGTLTFDDKRAEAFVKNFNNNVVGKDLDIDFEHKLFDGGAAGWVKAAEVRKNEGLFLQIEWTPRGTEAIKNKEFRYFSPEFFDEWQHPQTGAKFTDVLMGGGLTNRPFLKGIAPVNLSEMFVQVQQPGGKMADDPAAGPPQPQNTPPAPKAFTAEDLAKMLSENPNIVNDLPAVKALNEKIGEQATTITQLTESNKTLTAAAQGASVEVQLTEFTSGDRVLSAKALDILRPLLLTSPKELGEKIVEFAKAVQDGSAVVELGERGGKAPDYNGDAIKDFTTEIAKMRTADKTLTYAEAAMRLSTERPELHKAYLDATMSKS
jgi:phage I-like protein